MQTYTNVLTLLHCVTAECHHGRLNIFTLLSLTPSYVARTGPPGSCFLSFLLCGVLFLHTVWTSLLKIFPLSKNHFKSNSLLTCAFICIYCDISCEIMWHTCQLCTWIPAAEVKSVPAFKHVSQYGPSSIPAVAPTSVNKPQSWMDLRFLKDIFLSQVKIYFCVGPFLWL